MGSTNETDILGLSQFGDDDKPSWRGDVNSDNLKIDHFAEETYDALIVNSTEASEANAKATAAETKADAAKSIADNALPRSDFNSSSVLNLVKSVDGAGSGLDADTIRGQYVENLATKDDLNSVVRDSGYFGGRNMAVVIGDSNATGGLWPKQFCDNLGLVEHNFAKGGAGYSDVGNGDYITLARQAANSTAFSNLDVGCVLISSAANDTRAGVETRGQSASLFAYVRASFPNARVLVVPCLWPSDPVAATAGLGVYKPEWTRNLLRNVAQIRDSCLEYDCEYIDHSWTWLTGRSGVMVGQEVHFNDMGNAWIARMVTAYLRGESTRVDGSRLLVPLSNSISPSSDPLIAPLSVYREGWTVHIEGNVVTNSSGGSYLDVGTVPLGYRPNYSAVIPTRIAPYSDGLVTVYPSGTIRIWGTVPAGQQYIMDGTYRVG